MIYLLGIILVIAAIIINNNNLQFPSFGNKENKLDEYFVNDLRLRVYYGRNAKNGIANFEDYDKCGRVYLSWFTTDAPKNEIERQSEGKEFLAGQAIIRCAKGTYDIVSWNLVR